MRRRMAAAVRLRSQRKQWRLPCARLLDWAVLGLVSVLTWSCRRAHGQPSDHASIVYTVATGQELADQVAAFGVAGRDTTLVLPQGALTLSNVTFSPPAVLAANASALGRQPFSSGHLILTSGGEDPAAVLLDAAMRSDLTPQFASITTLSMEAFSMVNLCEQPLKWDKDKGTYYVTGFNTALFNRSRAYQSQETINMVFYGRPADMAVYIYIQAAQRTPFEELQTSFDPLLRTLPPLAVEVARLTRHSAQFTHYFNPATRHHNLTLKSVEDPDDAWLQRLRASGQLMAPRFCNGTLLGPEWHTDVDPIMGPLWVLTNSSQWLQTMQRAAALTNLTTMHLPPAVVFSGIINLSDAGVPLPDERPLLTGDALLLGAFNDVPDLTVPSVLDLAQRVDVLEVADSGRLYIAGVELTGLARQPLPALATSSAASGIANATSTLHLPFVRRSAARIAGAVQDALRIHNVTLSLPTDDYAALAALALQPGAPEGCLTPSQSAQLLHLRPGISFVSAGTDNSHPGTHVLLNSYRGWGVNGTVVWLAPDDPEDPAVQRLALCLAPPTASSSKAAMPSARLAGLVVGVVVGTLLVALVVVALLLYSRAHRRWRAGRDEAGTESSQGLKSNGSPAALWCHNPCCNGTWPYAKHTWVPEPGACQGLDAGAGRNGPRSEPPPSEHGPTSTTLTVDCSAALQTASRTGGSQGTVSDGLPASLPALDPCRQGGIHAVAGIKSALAVVVSTADTLTAQSARPVAAAQVAAAARQRGLPIPTPPSQTQDAATGDTDSTAVLGSAGAGSAQAGDAAGGPATGQLPLDVLRRGVESRANALGSDGNRVHVTGKLGSGSWGTVFKGEWRGLPVALKTMLFELPASSPRDPHGTADGQGASSPGLGKAVHSRALMEAAIAASVGHRNVVCTYHYDIIPMQSVHHSGGLQIAAKDAELDAAAQRRTPESGSSIREGEAFKMLLIQELCSTSLSMAAHLGAFQNPETREVEEVSVLTVLMDIARGLEYLHSKNIIHGDLKPANVLLKADMGCTIGVIAKLGDFGLSTCMEAGATHVSNFRSGTPFYVAPEVINQYRTLLASDIFSFGVIMWQLWSGMAPFVHNNGAFQRNPQFPHFSPPRVPPRPFERLLNLCLSTDPKARPTATQLVSGLQHLLDQACLAFALTAQADVPKNKP